MGQLSPSCLDPPRCVDLFNAYCGRSFDPACITIGKQLGEGSFGVVFEGWADGPRGRTRVVLKKVKPKVSGADEMRTSELYFNKRLQRSARGRSVLARWPHTARLPGA